MKTFKLYRFYSNNGDYLKSVKNNRTFFSGTTIGSLCEVKDGQELSPFCYTLERPLFYNGETNKRDDSNTKDINEACCINVGTYNLKWTYSPRFKRNLYLVAGTMDRSGIRIHPANDINDLHGCIALGMQIRKDTKSSDGFTYDFIITESRNACKRFETYCNGEEIQLIIEDLTQLENLKKIKIL
jgi:hypothetical protein